MHKVRKRMVRMSRHHLNVYQRIENYLADYDFKFFLKKTYLPLKQLWTNGGNWVIIIHRSIITQKIIINLSNGIQISKRIMTSRMNWWFNYWIGYGLQFFLIHKINHQRKPNSWRIRLRVSSIFSSWKRYAKPTNFLK